MAAHRGDLPIEVVTAQVTVHEPLKLTTLVACFRTNFLTVSIFENKPKLND